MFFGAALILIGGIVVFGALAAFGVAFSLGVGRRKETIDAPVKPSGPSAAAMEPCVVARGVAEVAAAVRRPGEVLVVNHWATWCEPCVTELPYLAATALLHRVRVRFLGVSWDRFTDDGPDVPERVDEARGRARAAYPCVVAPNEPEAFFTALQLADRRIPQTHVFDRGGRLVFFHVGELTDLAVREPFERAIAHALQS